MDKTEIVNEWFYLADKDIKSAEFLKNMIPLPLEIICYHCQQSAEKILKGFLIFKVDKFTKTHDLIMLNKKCLKYNLVFKEIDEECLRLTDYGVNIRYPFHLELTKQDMELAIKDANKIMKFILNKLDEIIKKTEITTFENKIKDLEQE